ncbi:MAG: flagellar hook assembly protein FlgD [Treponemataceae bacterium]
MEFQASMSTSEKAHAKLQVDSFNKTLVVNGRAANPELGKDDFLKLLIAQLANQDPTQPMENTQFIAQMAQFSSLEQMTNMGNEFSKLASMLNSSEAMAAVGKTVDVEVGDGVQTGVVEAAVRGANPQVQVNGSVYNLDQIKKIYTN